MKYYVQFPAGAHSLFTSALTQTIGECEVEYRDDSAMIFDTDQRITQSDQLPFASAVAQVLDSVPRQNVTKSIRRLASRLETRTLELPQGRDFRVMVHIDGELASIDADLRFEIEHELEVLTQSKVNPRGANREFWIVGRKQLDALLLCVRLPRNERQAAEPGALSSELASLLVHASNPDRADVFLDPFGGSGSLVRARLRMPYKSVTYSDHKRNRLHPALMRKVKSDRRVLLRSDDALQLPSIADGSVSVIVTDPPWGEFRERSMPSDVFNKRLVATFDRVLNAESGRFVVLTSRKQASALVQEFKSQKFRIHAQHGLLVNGHPATAIVGSR